MSKTLYIVTGPVGSGKSTLARALTQWEYCADYWFYDAEVYRFDHTKLPEARQWCQGQVDNAMRLGKGVVCVHNTCRTGWEVEFYIALAKSHGYRVSLVEMCNDFGSVHAPREVFTRMNDTWETKVWDGETLQSYPPETDEE